MTTGIALLQTALLLGVFVLLAGSYGVLYGVGRLASRPPVLAASFVCYALQCAVAAAVVARAPLADFWKGFLVVSTLAYFLIPPVTWRFLQRAH